MGFWLGVFDKESIQMITRHYYDNQEKYLDEDYNRSGLFEWEKRAINDQFGECRRLLVAGAGGGREVLALKKLGYEVDGFECNSKLVDLANALLNEEKLPGQVELAPMDRCPDIEGKYDGLIVGWGAYGHIQDSDQRVAFLRQLRDLASAGSPLLLSFFVRKDKGPRRFLVTALVGNLIRSITLRKRLEMGDTVTSSFVHFFTEEEIDSELERADYQSVFFDTWQYGHAVALAN